MTKELNTISDKGLPNTIGEYKVYKRMDSKGDYLQLFVPSINTDLGKRFRSVEELESFITEAL